MAGLQSNLKTNNETGFELQISGEEVTDLPPVSQPLPPAMHYK